MRGTSIIGRQIPNPNRFVSTPASKHSSFLSFSTSSGSSGRGRGRGAGGATPGTFDFTVRPDSDASKPDSPKPPPLPPSGHGHGRGRPPRPADPVLPAFSSFVSSIRPPASAPSGGIGRGRGGIGVGGQVPEPAPGRVTESRAEPDRLPTEPQLPSGISEALSGAGRGKPVKPAGPSPQIKEENRHIRVRPKPQPAAPARPKMSQEEAVKRAVGVLSRGGDGGGGGRGRGGVERGRGGRGRGRGRGRGWRDGGEGRGRGRGRGWAEDYDDDVSGGLYLGDNACGEKLAQKLGAENMNMLVEGFEEMSGRLLPSPMEDAFLDAFDTDCMIEFEPEYLMGDFEQNPDIDEKPPMPLRDVLEKVKPFMMAYEGIQSHEEWEEIVKETMESVPLLKEIVDSYSGPDRVTAKKQQEELERVAKTVPASAPPSVKRFADRAVLSLQSNPGWGFDKKCQFMDKLVREVSQHYK